MKLPWNSCLKICVSVFLLYLCIHYWNSAATLLGAIAGAATPLLIGCVIAYLVNILMSWYERRYFPKSNARPVTATRRPVCMLLAFLTLIAVVGLVIRLVVPQLADCFQLIFAELPDAIDALILYAEELNLLSEDLLTQIEAIDWKSRIEQIAQVLLTGVGGIVQTISSVASGIVTAFLSIIFSIYLLLSRDQLHDQVRRLMGHYLPGKWNEKISYVCAVLNDCFHRYIVGQCTEAVILGGLCTLGMFLLRLPYATMIGALIAFTALIPVAGAYIGAGVGAFMILTVSPVKALIFLVFIVVLQQLEGNLIYPRVVGSSLGLPGLWVLAAVTVGGGLMGILGMLLGVPFTAAVYRILREDMARREALAEGPAPIPETPESTE